MKKYKPITPSLRHVLLINTSVYAAKCHPIKQLSTYFVMSGGRNNSGKISVFNRGGGAKFIHRIVDFRRHYCGIPAKIINIEYDPGRTAFIALLLYKNGFFSYILSSFQLSIGNIIYSSNRLFLSINEIGSHGILSNISAGTLIHNLENSPSCGGKLLRAAGSFGLLLRKDNVKYSVVRLRSGEKRYINNKCTATIGVVSNYEHRYISLGKAGRSRWLHFRSKVRGVAMNPIDHPHGGDTSSGKVLVTPWSFPTKGKPTRKKINKYITNF